MGSNKQQIWTGDDLDHVGWVHIMAAARELHLRKEMDGGVISFSVKTTKVIHLAAISYANSNKSTAVILSPPLCPHHHPLSAPFPRNTISKWKQVHFLGLSRTVFPGGLNHQQWWKGYTLEAPQATPVKQTTALKNEQFLDHFHEKNDFLAVFASRVVLETIMHLDFLGVSCRVLQMRCLPSLQCNGTK